MIKADQISEAVAMGIVLADLAKLFRDHGGEVGQSLADQIEHVLPVDTARQIVIAEVERLQRIEQAAKAHKAAWDDGTNSTMAHETREALWAALEGE